MSSIIANIIVIVILICVVGAAIYYIYKEKKKGAACIGCPMAGDCAKAKAGACTGHEESAVYKKQRESNYE